MAIGAAQILSAQLTISGECSGTSRCSGARTVVHYSVSFSLSIITLSLAVGVLQLLILIVRMITIPIADTCIRY